MIDDYLIFTITLYKRYEEKVLASSKKTPANLFWAMKAVKGNRQEKGGYFLYLNFRYCQRKFSLNVTMFSYVGLLKDFLSPHMTSFKHESRFVRKNIHSFDTQ